MKASELLVESQTKQMSPGYKSSGSLSVLLWVALFQISGAPTANARLLNRVLVATNYCCFASRKPEMTLLIVDHIEWRPVRRELQ